MKRTLAIGPDVHVGLSGDRKTLEVRIPVNVVVQEVSARTPGALDISALTPRQRQVLDAIRRGLLNKEIADELHIAVRTVKLHAAQLYERLGVDGRKEILRRFGVA